MSYEIVSAEELPELIRKGHTLIDVRTPSEFRAEHVVGAELSPLDQLDTTSFPKHKSEGLPIYILCQSGKRARVAAEKLSAAGHRSIHVVDGGTDAAKAADVEIEYGSGAISIERQVRIGAGSLVALGTLAGVFIHSGFLAVPIFVGSGLVFAGITNTCGMAMMLARMPWNR